LKRNYALAVSASLVAAMVAATAAGAAGAKPVAPASAAGRLRVELRAMRSGVARENAELAVLRAGLGAAHPDIARLRLRAAQLQGVVRHNEARLTTLAKQSSILQKAISTPLAVAVEQVRREVEWAQGGVSTPVGQLQSEAAMDYTIGHVSTGAFGYFELVGAPLPGQHPNEILAAQAGLCGQASQVFAAIVKSLGLPVRAILFYYTDPWGAADGHTAVEVSYGGSWHFYDPTFGQFWTDANGNVLSIAQVRAGLGTQQRDAASFTNLVEDVSLGNDTWFETDPATKVEVETWSLNG
jgi:Transglutaminase-like superfamily